MNAPQLNLIGAEPVDLANPRETVANPPVLALGPASAGCFALPAADFDWSSENADIVVKKQPMTAIYLNPSDQVVIRQESDDGDTDADPFVFISREHLPAVIDRLQAILKG